MSSAPSTTRRGGRRAATKATCGRSSRRFRRRTRTHARAVEVAERVSLAYYTTMGLGGPARFFVHARYDPDVRAAWAWARERNVALRVLGGGSNVVADEAEIDALVVHVDTRGIEWRET